jgi:hypothetical protein
MAVEIKDGKIFVDGVDQGLERDDTQHLRLTAKGIHKVHSVSLIDGKPFENRCLAATGKIHGSLGLAGQSYKVREVEVVIQAAPPDRADLDWHAFVGASFADGEIFEEDSWAIQTRIPGDVWRRLEADYDAGRVREIDLAVQAPLWAKRTAFFVNPRPDMMLTPDSNGNGGATHGKTSGITWRDRMPPVESPTTEKEPALPKRLVDTIVWSMPAIVVLLVIIAVS